MSSQYDAGEQGPASHKLSQMIMDFRFTQMLYVAAKLSIADLLKDGPQSVEALAQTTSAHAPSLYRFLRALASVGIFAEDEQGRFGLTPLAVLLQKDVPGSRRPQALVFGEPARWRAWSDLLYSVTTGENGFRHINGTSSWEYLANNPELGANFDDFMTAETYLQTAHVMAAYDFSGGQGAELRTIVDVAGGHGAFIAAILQANPQLHSILCDAPHVIEGARPVLEAAGVKDRCELVPCDFFSSVPAGGDAYILKQIIHDWDDESALAILKVCRRVVPETGRLLVVERIIPPGNGPFAGKLTDLHMLVVYGGRERTEAEFAMLLSEAGFRLARVVPTQSEFSVIEAVPA
jgi:ubiquinone/menaquinone biosynthesis C-methylase UbiE